MSHHVAPLFGHITSSPEWNKLADEIAFSLHAALQPDADARQRFEAKARYQRLSRRRRNLSQQANDAVRAFDAKAREVADLRRHAFSVPQSGSLRSLMN